MRQFRKIIAEAWLFTQNNKKMILWYAFLPSLITTVSGMLYIVYQYYAFRSSPLFEDWEQSFAMILVSNVWQIINDNLFTLSTLIIIAIIVAVLYILVPPLCQGAIIQLIARKRNGQDVRTRDGIKYGLLNFLPIFEFSWVKKTFSFVSIITSVAFLWRNLGTGAVQAFSPVIIIIAIVAIIMTLLFTYTEFFIVIDNRRVIESIGKSVNLVITHLEATILLSILMLIISIRILIQIFFVLIIPVIIVALIYVLASAMLPGIALVIAGIVGLIMLYIAAYISSIVHVFADSVWTFTFLELTAEEEISAREKINA
jgi:hypothetical protein